nr:uncharacterized protein LOC112004312 [Quercus suber]
MKPDNFQVLEFLLLGDSNIVTLSESISRSARLELLDIDNCNQLQEIPRVPQSMGMVDARSCIGLDPKTSSRLLNQILLQELRSHIAREECGAAFKGQDPMSRSSRCTFLQLNGTQQTHGKWTLQLNHQMYFSAFFLAVSR